MAFVVESGAGLSTATSYLSVADADTYHAGHGAPAAWTAATTATKEGALMQATRYLDAHFTWRGSIAVEAQALGWPRSFAVDDEGRDVDDESVPIRVEEATALLALYHLSSPLDAPYARGGEIRRQRVGSVEVEYADYAPAAPWMPFVRGLVRGLYEGSSSQVTLLRA